MLFALTGVAASGAPAAETWLTMCARCHGVNGNGKTKEGARKWIKDYTDPKVQAEFADAGLLKNMLLGIESDDGKERMPAYKEKLTPTEAKELVALIRSFKR